MKLPNQSLGVSRTSRNLTRMQLVVAHTPGIQMSQSKICSDCFLVRQRLKQCQQGGFTFTLDCQIPTRPGLCGPCFEVLTSERNCCQGDIERETCPLPFPISSADIRLNTPSVPIPPP